MNKSNNRFLLILIALMLAATPLRGMSASSIDMAGMDMANSDAGCPHMNMANASDSSASDSSASDSADSGMQEDCCKNDCSSDAGCDNACFSCVHAGAGITGAVVLAPDVPLTVAPPFFFDHFSNYSFSPPLRPPALLHS